MEATSTTRLTLRHVRRIEIPYRAFPEQAASRTQSPESVDYFGTIDYFSGRKKEQS